MKIVNLNWIGVVVGGYVGGCEAGCGVGCGEIISHSLSDVLSCRYIVFKSLTERHLGNHRFIGFWFKT